MIKSFIHTLFLYSIRFFFFMLQCTWRVRKVNFNALESLLNTKTPLIIGLWHNKLIILPFLQAYTKHRPLVIAISKSRDGHLASAFAETFKNVYALRVAHNDRHGALMQMIHALDSNALLTITPDGPRGPLHAIKPGIIFCARKTGATIIGLKWKAKYSMRLKSWDQFEIPLPFSKIILECSPPIQTTAINSDEELTETLKNAFSIH